VDKENNNEINKNWFAVYTKPRAEKKVYDRIIESGIETYLPLITTIRIWSDRKKKVTSPLISSIIFVRIEELKLNELYKIQGITGILKYLKKPAKIKEFEIENLKILLNDSENISTIENESFEKGDNVRVVKGPFLGLIAECFEIKGKHRIIVNIKSTNNVFEVNVPISFIEKI
jgi:transcription antitermination factor NusG